MNNKELIKLPEANQTSRQITIMTIVILMVLTVGFIIYRAYQTGLEDDYATNGPRDVNGEIINK